MINQGYVPGCYFLESKDEHTFCRTWDTTKIFWFNMIQPRSKVVKLPPQSANTTSNEKSGEISCLVTCHFFCQKAILLVSKMAVTVVERLHPIWKETYFFTYISTSWWFQPLWKICSSKWESSPNRGENKKYLKPPPSQPTYQRNWFNIICFFPRKLATVTHGQKKNDQTAGWSLLPKDEALNDLYSQTLTYCWWLKSGDHQLIWRIRKGYGWRMGSQDGRIRG